MTEDQHAQQDPTQQYPQPEFPEQDQRDQHPGLEAEMQPVADYGYETYRGTGRLEGKAATKEYRSEMDPVGRFLGDFCLTGDDQWVATPDLKAAYAAWCRDNGEEPQSWATVWKAIRGRVGVTPERNREERGWRGIGLNDEAEDAAEGYRYATPF